ncbi:MAG: M20 family metallopeptidase [Candidatus Omnitrophota bacterium]|jgi:succinyl-diaminopimelate desuccinylase
MINQKRLIALTGKLIGINSENPPGDEIRIARFVTGYLEGLGIKSKIYEFKKGRPNVVAVFKGRDKKRSLLATPHLDTVPAGKNWKFPPFRGIVSGGKMYGLGTTDCKGNLACLMEVIKSLVEDRIQLDYNLLFAATADEESGSGLGLIPLLDKGILKPDAALVLDADDFEVIVAQKGLMHLKLIIAGKRAHGAYPWLGRNAIDAAVRILGEIKAYRFRYEPGVQKQGSAYLRPATVNIGTMRGGDKVNVVADWCECELDFRYLPGMNAQRILKDLRAITKKHARKFTVEIEGIQNPYYIGEEHPLVVFLKQAARATGVRARIKGSEGATVITFFQHKNIPAVATGFGCGGCAHTVDEYAKVDNLYKGARMLEEFLKIYKF